MNRKYVFFWNPEIYYQKAFEDIIDYKNVFILFGIKYPSRIIEIIHNIHFSNKINLKIHLPLKKMWRSMYLKDIPLKTKGEKYVFIFHGDFYWMKSMDYFKYLKEKYPYSKCVFFLTDTIKRYSEYFKGKYYGDFNIDYLKNNCDLVLTYNKVDAKNESLQYFPTFYSSIHKNECKEYKNESDVFFVGRAKDRLEEIHTIYKSLSASKMKCDFYITDVPKKYQLKSSNIHYNKMLSYNEVIEHIEKSYGILEIVQGDTLGFTFRCFEALLFNKNLITNNKIMLETRYSKSPKLFEIDINKPYVDYNKFKLAVQESYNYREDYSPKKLLKYLDDLFEEEDGDYI